MASERHSTARRAFTRALGLYPAAFRERFGEAMTAAFMEKWESRRTQAGRWAALSFGVGAVVNAALNGLAERRLARHRATGRSGWRGPRAISDVRRAGRLLLKSPGFTATVTLVLALGIGVSTAVFSVVDAVLIRPVPYAQADRLAALSAYSEQGKFTMRGFFTSRTVLGWREQADLFDAVEASETATFVYEDTRGADLLTGAYVTPGLFGLLGVGPAHGRPFILGEGREGAPPAIILSDRFWRRRGASPDAVGTAITLDGARHTVVGIMPASFRYPDERHDVWLPYDVAEPPRRADGGVRSDSAEVNQELRGSLVPVVRRRSDVSREAVAEQVRARGLAVRQAAEGDATLSARLAALDRGLDERTERSLFVLGVAVGFLLLIACANVASLTVARTIARAQERATRVALGASRGALVREAFVEHAILGAAGALAGLGVAVAVVGAVHARLPEAMTSSTLNAIDVDGRALVFLSAVAAFTLFAVSLPAAVLSSRATGSDVLGRHSRSATPASRRMRTTLVVVEVGLSVVLVMGATLMSRSLLRLQAIDVGINAEGLLAMRLGLPSGAFDDVVARRTFIEGLLDRLAAHPAVHRASAGRLPTSHAMITRGPLEFGDRPNPPTEPAMMNVFEAWPGYFEAAGIRLLEGRGFSAENPEGAAVVSEGFARRHWPDRSALGMRFRVGKHPWRMVVGVANEVRRFSEDDDSGEFELYYPHDQVSGVMVGVRPVSRIAEFVTVMVRADDPGAVAALLPDIVHGVDPRVVVAETVRVERELADEIARPRIVFLMMAVFAAGGLLLVAAGLYGLLAQLVAQRRREIGIRLALGASPRDVGRRVVRNGFVMVGVGLAVGLGAAFLLVDAMRSLLYEVEPSDPAAAAIVAAVIVVTGLIAVWRPARQAMRVDPVALLREQ